MGDKPDVAYQRVLSVVFDLLRDEVPASHMLRVVREAEKITQGNEVRYDMDSLPLMELAAFYTRRLFNMQQEGQDGSRVAQDVGAGGA